MGTFIVCALLAVAVFFAARHVYRQHKSGTCAGGCAGCSGCCHGKGQPHQTS